MTIALGVIAALLLLLCVLAASISTAIDRLTTAVTTASESRHADAMDARFDLGQAANTVAGAIVERRAQIGSS